MPLLHGIILAALSQLALTIVRIDPLVAISQSGYPKIADTIASLTCLALVNFALLNLVESLYRSLQGWREQSLSFGNLVIYYLFLGTYMAAYIGLVGIMPVPTLAVTLLIWLLTTLGVGTPPTDRG